MIKMHTYQGRGISPVILSLEYEENGTIIPTEDKYCCHYTIFDDYKDETCNSVSRHTKILRDLRLVFKERGIYRCIE